MAAIHKFHPYQGFDLEHDMINNAQTRAVNGAIPRGYIVDFDNNGVITAANDYGYFLMQEVLADRPNMLDFVLNDFQWVVQAGNPVSVLIPKKGNRVLTEHVIEGLGGVAPAVGGLLSIVAGVYNTDAQGTAGRIKNIWQDSVGDTLYLVEIL